MSQKIYESGVMQIVWFSDKRLIFAEWKTPGTIQEQKSATDMTIELMKEKRVNEILFDPRNLGIFRKEFKEWCDTDWFPRALNYGLKRIGNLLPTSELAKMSLDQILTKVENFESQYFDDFDKAAQWLKRPYLSRAANG